MANTTGSIAKLAGVSRAVVCHAIDREQIEPAQRAGIVRIFTDEQLPVIIEAVRNTMTRRSRLADSRQQACDA